MKDFLLCGEVEAAEWVEMRVGHRGLTGDLGLEEGGLWG
jgi:hypothetical protein